VSQAQRGRAVVRESFMGDNRGWLGMKYRQFAGGKRIRPERGASAMANRHLRGGFSKNHHAVGRFQPGDPC